MLAIYSWLSLYHHALILAEVSLNCIDIYDALEWTNNTKLANTYSEHLIHSNGWFNPLEVELTPLKFMTWQKPKNDISK